MRKLAALFFLAVIFTPSAFSESVSEPANALVNGGFEEAGEKKSQAAGWKIEGQGKRFRDDAGNWKLKLTADAASPNAVVAQTVSLPDPAPTIATAAFVLKAAKVQLLNPDVEGRIAVAIEFLDAQGNSTGKSFNFAEWIENFSTRPWSGLVRVPSNARTAELRIELEEIAGEVTIDEAEFFWGLPEDRDRQNLLADGGFEYQNAWSRWLIGPDHKIFYPGREGHALLGLGKGSAEEASGTAQEFFIPREKKIKNAALELLCKLDKVAPSQKGGGLRAEIEFRDGERKFISRKTLGPWTGTKDWTLCKESFDIPKEAQRATFILMMENSGGEAWVDQVRIEAFSGKETVLRPVESRNDVSNWKVFMPVDGNLKEPLDVSLLLEKPAGKHGFLKVGEDGHFYFEDGTQARFLGINLQPPTALPSHEEAERLAERLSQLGFNLVRLHHLDAPWPGKPKVFDADFDDTQHFSAENLDRLGYFIAQLKAKGIYIYLDLFVSRKFKKGDGVADYLYLKPSIKTVAQFSRRLIELQKQYAKDLFLHENPHTGLRLVDDPGIVLTEIINESTLVPSGKKKLQQMPAAYQEELRALWKEHLAKEGKDVEAGRERYQNLDDPEVALFYAGLQRKYFREMHDFLRGLGVRIPIAGSNLAIDGWDLAVNAEFDFVDRHAYWDHPMGGYGDLVRFNNSLLLEEVEPGNLSLERKRINPILKLVRHRVKGKPFVVGEWNVNWPNEFRAVGPLLMAAYASFHDWDAIIQFNFEGHLSPEKIESNFDVSSKPDIFLQLPAAARLFYGRHVKPANEKKSLPVLSKEIIPFSLGLVHGVERILSQPSPSPREGKGLADSVSSGLSWTSDTGELTWDAGRGVAVIQTPKTQAVIGRLGGAPHTLRAVTFDVETPFAALSLTSLDEEPLENSKHMLLTAVARAENEETIYNATRTLLRTGGHEPILMEPISGFASLPLKGRGEPKIFILDAAGKRIREIDPQIQGETMKIPLEEAPLYEITFLH